MFGDNLSFISDTTIAACQGQGCAMKDKFRENFKIALPAALVTLVFIMVLSIGADLSGSVQHGYDLIELVPYLIVLVGGIIGINVFVVLLSRHRLGFHHHGCHGRDAPQPTFSPIWDRAPPGMFETTMVAVLVCRHLRPHPRIWRVHRPAQRHQEFV